MNSVCVEMFGDFALFTTPHSKNNGTFESSKIPTSSAIVGVLKAYYWHPHFEWVVDKVRVMNNYDDTFTTTNIFVHPDSKNGVFETKTYLKNIHYIVQAHAELIQCDKKYVEKYDKNPYNQYKAIIEQFKRRVNRNKPYKNPFFGKAECECYIKMSDVDINAPLGYYKDSGDKFFPHMVMGFKNYSDYRAYTCKKDVCFADLTMKNGLIEYPNILHDDDKMIIKHLKGV